MTNVLLECVKKARFCFVNGGSFSRFNIPFLHSYHGYFKNIWGLYVSPLSSVITFGDKHIWNNASKQTAREQSDLKPAE